MENDLSATAVSFGGFPHGLHFRRGKKSLFGAIKINIELSGVDYYTVEISGLLGGSNCFLIGDLIQQQFLGNEYNLNYGAATSLMLMVVVFISMGIFNSFDNDEMEDSMI